MKINDVVDFYQRAKAQVFESGYADEYMWQQQREFRLVTEREFLREYSWVVLNCGFREAVIRRVFPYVSMAFFDFCSAQQMVDDAAKCIRIASFSFANLVKLRAIVDGASLVASIGIEELCRRVLKDPNILRQLPFIGPVTLAHLLKNLGVEIAKNDRHLARLSFDWGFANAEGLCGFLASRTGERASTIDIVLWRFCTLKGPNTDYLPTAIGFDRTRS